MKRFPRTYKVLRSTATVGGILSTAVFVAWVGLSAIVKKPVEPGRPVRFVTTAETLSPGEELVPASAVTPALTASVPIPVTPAVLTTYVVLVKAAVTDEAGADVAMTVKEEACTPPASSQPIRAFVANSDRTELSIGLTRAVCVQALAGQVAGSFAQQPFSQLVDGHWSSLSATSLPELSSAVRAFAFTDPNGVERRLYASAVGYCEDAGAGCSASINLEVTFANDRPSTRLKTPNSGVSPLSFNADAE